MKEKLKRGALSNYSISEIKEWLRVGMETGNSGALMSRDMNKDYSFLEGNFTEELMDRALEKYTKSNHKSKDVRREEREINSST